MVEVWGSCYGQFFRPSRPSLWGCSPLTTCVTGLHLCIIISYASPRVRLMRVPGAYDWHACEQLFAGHAGGLLYCSPLSIVLR